MQPHFILHASWLVGKTVILYILVQVCNTINQERVTASAVVVVASFLIQQGADIHIKNKKHQTPLQICSPLDLDVLSTFANARLLLCISPHASA